MVGTAQTKEGLARPLAERVKDALETLSEDGVEAFLDLLPPRVVYVDRPQVVESRVKEGRAAVARWLESLAEVWGEGMEVIADELLDIDQDRVLAVSRICGRGARSGIAIEDAISILVTEQDGELALWEVFDTKQEALAAAQSA